MSTQTSSPASTSTPAGAARTYALAQHRRAAVQGAPLRRMTTAFPVSHATAPLLYAWHDGRILRTSDGRLRTLQIAEALAGTDGSGPPRTLVLPTARDARRLGAALKGATVVSADQERVLRRARRIVDIALAVPWLTRVVILSRTLPHRFWEPSETLPRHDDDLGRWVGWLTGSTSISHAVLEQLTRFAVQGSTHLRAVDAQLYRLTDAIVANQAFPGVTCDNKTFQNIERLGGQWDALVASDPLLRPYNEARRRAVAVTVSDQPTRRGTALRCTVPAGSIPFRNGATVWILDDHDPSARRQWTGQITDFGYRDGTFVVDITVRTGQGDLPAAASGRIVHLVEQPFSGVAAYGHRTALVWERGLPPVEPVPTRPLPAIALAGTSDRSRRTDFGIVPREK